MASGQHCELQYGITQEELKTLRMWNAASVPRTDSSIVELISLQCRERPNATAVSGWDGGFTYGELDSVTTAVAIFLRERGITNGQYVPLCLAKSKWTIVTILAVLKAGAVFIPLDPSDQKSRINTILEELGTVQVICSSETFDLIAACTKAAPIVIPNDCSSRHLEPRSINDSMDQISGDDLAFVMFTVLIFSTWLFRH